jgi:hypothetical protein
VRLPIAKFNEMWDNRHIPERDAGLQRFWADLRSRPGGVTSTQNSWAQSLQPNGSGGYKFKDNDHHMVPLIILFRYGVLPLDLCDPKVRRKYGQALEKVRARNTTGVNRGIATEIYDLFINTVPHA